MVIRHNLLASNIMNNRSVSGGKMTKHLEKLSSGYQINRSADDAAGLSISEKMCQQIRGLTRVSANAQDGISLIKTAEGALNEVSDMLQCANVLAIQAANGTSTEADCKIIQAEFSNLKKEIDRVAYTTKFNQMGLLDGSLSRTKGTKNLPVYKTTAALPAEGMASIKNTKETVRGVQVTQKPSSIVGQSGNDNLKAALQDSIVPQAVERLLQTFGDTFGYLRGSNIGIGLGVADTGNSGALAAVRTSLTTKNDPVTQQLIGAELGFTLLVNTAHLTFDPNSSDGLTADSRKSLEKTIVHEMMHAMMQESLTAGMMDRDANGNVAEGFPMWFVEGTAQAASGGMDWMAGLGINKNSTEAEITAALSNNNNRLGRPTNKALYGTGYLAVMYLGSLAGGGDDAASVARGVDKILSDIRKGKSMDRAIADNTNYQGTSDFETNFANDGAKFAKGLLGASGNGTGGLATGNYTDSDLLSNMDKTPDVFHLNKDVFEVTNAYPPGHVVISGGTKGGMGMDYNATLQPNPPAPPNPAPQPNPPVEANGNKGGIVIQVGAAAGDTIVLPIEAMNTTALGIDVTDISTAGRAMTAIEDIQKAIDIVSAQRAKLGAYQNRLEYTVRNLNNMVENTQAAERLIRDTDMAKEKMELVKQILLMNAGQALLAQANQNPQSVLRLLS